MRCYLCDADTTARALPSGVRVCERCQRREDVAPAPAWDNRATPHAADAAGYTMWKRAGEIGSEYMFGIDWATADRVGKVAGDAPPKWPKVELEAVTTAFGPSIRGRTMAGGKPYALSALGEDAKAAVLQGLRMAIEASSRGLSEEVDSPAKRLVDAFDYRAVLRALESTLPQIKAIPKERP